MLIKLLLSIMLIRKGGGAVLSVMLISRRVVKVINEQGRICYNTAQQGKLKTRPKMLEEIEKVNVIAARLIISKEG